MSVRVLHRRQCATPQALWHLVRTCGSDFATLRFFGACRRDHSLDVGFLQEPHGGAWRATVCDYVYSLPRDDILQEIDDKFTRAAVTVFTVWPPTGTPATVPDVMRIARELRLSEERAAHAEFRTRLFAVAVTTKLSSQVLHDCVWRVFVCTCEIA
jgi:hypothetical protein